jgi:hypothetical protein
MICQCISYGRLQKTRDGPEWMSFFSMGFNSLEMAVLMHGGAHGHKKVVMVYVGLENGCPLIWVKMCVFCQLHTMHML